MSIQTYDDMFPEEQEDWPEEFHDRVYWLYYVVKKRNAWEELKNCDDIYDTSPTMKEILFDPELTDKYDHSGSTMIWTVGTLKCMMGDGGIDKFLEYRKLDEAKLKNGQWSPDQSLPTPLELDEACYTNYGTYSKNNERCHLVIRDI